MIVLTSKTKTYDAIVVGTGMTGGWALKELTELGLETLALERGRDVRHRLDYETEHDKPWELEGRGRVAPDVIADYPVQQRTYVFSEYTRHWFAKDTEYPIVEEEPFTWVQPNIVGGRSVLWGRQSYRMSPMDFTANLEDGHGVDWPLRYEDLEPWYDRVEREIGVSGSKEGMAQLPDGQFLKPMEMNALEKLAKQRIEAAFPDRRMMIARTATLSEDHRGRRACHYCGPCERGCSTSSYYSTQSVALPAARKTGKLTLVPDALIESVLYDKGRNRVTGVRVIDTKSREVTEYKARLVFLCASTLGTARILLHSKSERFPTGLANSSDQVGRNITEHHARVGALGIVEGLEDRYYRGNRPCGTYIPRFRNLGPETKHPDFVRGYGVQGGASRMNWSRGQTAPGFGAGFKESLTRPGPWRFMLQAYGEMLPNEENRCVLDDEVQDAWGLPALRLRVKRGPNELAMRKDMVASALEMLEAVGAKGVQPFDLAFVPPGTPNHEMGTARMGRDPKTSVLNAFCQSHDVPNLFVPDASCMTSAACQNPSLTYMALTSRATHYAAEQLEKGEL
ncbi:MAG: GMC family oxidoreductase [Acidobacteriota bacterium]